VNTVRRRVVARASVIVRRVVVVEPLVRTRLALRRAARHERVVVVLRGVPVAAPVAVRAPRCGVVLASRTVLARVYVRLARVLVPLAVPALRAGRLPRVTLVPALAAIYTRGRRGEIVVVLARVARLATGRGRGRDVVVRGPGALCDPPVLS